jgi:hypothetical protein
MMQETVVQSQRRYIQTALIVAQELLILHLERHPWKRSKEVTTKLRSNVAGWKAELARHDAEYGVPPIPANPAWDLEGMLRPAAAQWRDLSHYSGPNYYTPVDEPK